MSLSELKNKIMDAIARFIAKLKGSTDTSDVEDSIDYKKLQYSWGGFNGSAAKEMKESVIGNLAIQNTGMSYGWLSGGCEQLGASNARDFDHTYACLFVLRNGVWRGGKFDAISTSRVTRDFKNIYGEGYKGWPKDAVSTATDFAFVIVSKDGSKRTNVIRFKR